MIQCEIHGVKFSSDGCCPDCPKAEYKGIKDIPQISHREMYMKTCDLMYSHYKILNIIDIETALGIIRGILENEK